jgi:hypothetical protein
MVPAATAASTGIEFISRNWPDTCDFFLLPYIKYKTYKTSSNRRGRGKVENFLNSRLSANFGPFLCCEKSSHLTAESLPQLAAELGFTPTIHNFHIQFTSHGEEDLLAMWKSVANPCLAA